MSDENDQKKPEPQSSGKFIAAALFITMVVFGAAAGGLGNPFAPDDEFGTTEGREEITKYNRLVETKRFIAQAAGIHAPRQEFNGMTIRQKCEKDNQSSEKNLAECLHNRTEDAMREWSEKSIFSETKAKLGQSYNSCSGGAAPICAVQKTWNDEEPSTLYRAKYAYAIDPSTADMAATIAMFGGALGLGFMGARIYRREKNGDYNDPKP